MSATATTWRIPAVGVDLDGDLTVPDGAEGLVLFAHGSGSSRRSPRNRAVAGTLQRRGLATLLADLLTPDEEQYDASTGGLRFDIAMLAQRLTGIADWAGRRPETAGLPLGLFGASTGAAAALVTAAARPGAVRAVVSRGGRPDLAGEALAAVAAPTLLVVGGLDRTVLQLNEEARAAMTAPVELRIVPGASHLFEEPGALDLVARHAGEWFAAHLVPPTGRSDRA
ncbi:dienelactone hydrolase family protein [Dactylosporangium sp. NPDC048998]|uniref:dienelactone hydrolase family protein n=1 Tax=Dactylosporangium sp. NPDC048998 TaxID=3363976 RepID=UPI003713EDB4